MRIVDQRLGARDDRVGGDAERLRLALPAGEWRGVVAALVEGEDTREGLVDPHGVGPRSDDGDDEGRQGGDPRLHHVAGDDGADAGGGAGQDDVARRRA